MNIKCGQTALKGFISIVRMKIKEKSIFKAILYFLLSEKRDYFVYLTLESNQLQLVSNNQIWHILSLKHSRKLEPQRIGLEREKRTLFKKFLCS